MFPAFRRCFRSVRHLRRRLVKVVITLLQFLLPFVLKRDRKVYIRNGFGVIITLKTPVNVNESFFNSEVEALKKTFDCLCFTVSVVVDCEEPRSIEKLEGFRDNQNFDEYDGCLVAIISYNQIDDHSKKPDKLTLFKLKEVFDHIRCSQLKGKPKLLFLLSKNANQPQFCDTSIAGCDHGDWNLGRDSEINDFTVFRSSSLKTTKNENDFCAELCNALKDNSPKIPLGSILNNFGEVSEDGIDYVLHLTR